MESGSTVKLACGRRVSDYYPRLVLASLVSRTRTTQRQPITVVTCKLAEARALWPSLIWLDKVRGGQSAKFLHARAPIGPSQSPRDPTRHRVGDLQPLCAPSIGL
jgi:hypothetical protein